MNVVRCLLLDDREDFLPDLSLAMRDSWQELFPDTRLEVEANASPLRVLMEIEEGRFHYDFIVVDIMFSDPGTDSVERTISADGLRVIQRARKKFPDMGILAISVLPEWREVAIQLGADEFWSKNAERGPELQQLLAEVSAAWRSQGAELSLESVSPQLRAVVHEVGENALKSFAARSVSGRIKSVRFTGLPAGYSGAWVVGVALEERTPSHGLINHDLLLKVARDRLMLEGELANAKLLKSLCPTMAVQFVQRRRPLYSDGWYCITAFKLPAKTLIDWLLLEAPAPRTIRDFLERLLLASGSWNALPEDDNQAPHEALRRILTESREARLLETLSEFKDLASEFGSAFFDETRILDFVESGRLGEARIGKIPSRTKKILSHGDLHSGNILVTATLEPVIVDAASLKPLHGLADLGRLLVDLFVTGIDPGAASHQWERFDYWLKEAGTIIEGDATISEGPGRPDISVLSAVRWLRKNAGRVAEHRRVPFEEWELVQALAVEFLRASCRRDLPSPKRALALACASRALAVAGRKCNETFEDP